MCYGGFGRNEAAYYRSEWKFAQATADPPGRSPALLLADGVVDPALLCRCELPVSALPILLTGHEPHALLRPPPHVILSNAKDLLLRHHKSRSFTESTLERSEGFRMTC